MVVKYLLLHSTEHNKERLNLTETTNFKDWVQVLAERISTFHDTTVFFRSMNFVDINNSNLDVVYLNLLRDPVSRFMSEFNYNRQIYFGEFLKHDKMCFDDEKYQSFQKNINKSWLEQNLYNMAWWNYKPNITSYNWNINRYT